MNVIDADQHKHELGLSTEEAVAKAEQPCSLSRMWAIEDRCPEEVTYADLEELGRTYPERALRRFEEIKAAALEQVRSGHFAGACVQRPDAPSAWQQAIFLAIRTQLADGLQPRLGIEQLIFDQMAQALVGEFYWQRVFSDQAGLLDMAADAVGMVDRFNRIFHRNLRGLVNLRKVPPTVFVQNAHQVNFGQPQANGQNGNGKRRGKARQATGTPEACTCLGDRRSLFGENG